MPVLEVSTFFPNVKALYLTIIPAFIYLNNFVGPQKMESVFTRDFLLAQFDKFSSSKGAAAGSSSAFTATATASNGLAPRVPSILRGMGRQGRLLSVGIVGLLQLNENQ
jgi:hypothetical protein